MVTPLLGSTDGNEQVIDLLMALGWLVVICLIVVAVGVVIYKRFSPNLNRPDMPATFSLADLRSMRDEGQITEEEFQRARAKVIGENQALAADTSSPPRASTD